MNENISISTQEILNNDISKSDLFAIGQIASAMSLFSKLELELGKCNDLEENESTSAFDERFEKFNIKITFQNETFEFGLQDMDAYGNIQQFLIEYMKNLDINRLI